MSSSTINLYVYADTYSDIIDRAEVVLCEFLKIDSLKMSNVQYELFVRPSDPNNAAAGDHSYTAEVIARVKK